MSDLFANPFFIILVIVFLILIFSVVGLNNLFKGAGLNRSSHSSVNMDTPSIQRSVQETGKSFKFFKDKLEKFQSKIKNSIQASNYKSMKTTSRVSS